MIFIISSLFRQKKNCFILACKSTC